MKSLRRILSESQTSSPIDMIELLLVTCARRAVEEVLSEQRAISPSGAPLVGIRDLARALGVSRDSIDRLPVPLPRIRIGGQWRYDIAECRAELARRQQQPEIH